MDELESLRMKGRIAEVLEGGKVLRQDLFRELKSLQETIELTARDFDELLNEMLLDETVRKIIVEENGSFKEYWELME
jgi:hypothetical protein